MLFTMRVGNGQLQSNPRCTLVKKRILALWLLALISTIFSSQSIIYPTDGHLDSFSSLGPQTKEGYYYFVAELQGGSTPAKVAHGLSAEFVRQVTPGNKYLFRKLKPINVTFHMMGDQVSLNRREFIENLTNPSSIQVSSQIRRLELYPQKAHTHSLFRRDSPSRNAYYEETVKELGFTDPGFEKQWHLRDLNVADVWLKGITGKGVTVAVVDDGVNYEHEDLKDNYLAEGSYDFNSKSNDPRPKDKKDSHGTACAGLIAAKPNDVCGVGVAYRAKFSAIRLIAKSHTDQQLADALQYRNDINDIYSCSWKPGDDQTRVLSLSDTVKEAFFNSTHKGRGGKGSIYVFAAGNSANDQDNCSFNVYSNLIETITVGAIDRDDIKSEYSEWCTSLLISTYSNQNRKSAIYTTSSTGGECRDDFGGTSAATPQVAGVIALGLEARPRLTWRDVQNVLIQSAVTVQQTHSSWETTYSGRPYSPFYGYGKIDASRFVDLAKSISLLGPQTKYMSPVQTVEKTIPYSRSGLGSYVYVSEEDLKAVKLERLEHVTVTVKILHNRVADLFIDLVSPNNIRSPLVVSRQNDKSTSGFHNSTFLTLKHWHEPAVGNWSLWVYDLYEPNTQGHFVSWELTLYGESPAGLTALEIFIIVISCLGALLLIAGAIYTYIRYFRKKQTPAN